MMYKRSKCLCVCQGKKILLVSKKLINCNLSFKVETVKCSGTRKLRTSAGSNFKKFKFIFFSGFSIFLSLVVQFKITYHNVI